MSNLRLNTLVVTPRGKANFIGYFRDGHDVQVSRHVPASEFTREQCEARNASVKEMSHSDFAFWQKSARFCVNEVYAAGEIKGS